MRPLRPPSDRPGLVVDPHSRDVADPTDRSRVGHPAPFGRERVVYALPLQWVQLKPFTVVVDPHSRLVAQPPERDLVGRDTLIIHRLLYARWTEDTRRIAG